MSITGGTRSKLAERFTVDYTPDGPGQAGSVEVFINLGKQGTDRAVVKAVSGGGRQTVLANENYGLTSVYSDLNAGQQLAVRNALRTVLQNLFSVTIQDSGLSLRDFVVYVDQFSALWTGVGTTSFTFNAWLDTEEKLCKLDGPDAGTEADATFRYRHPRWESLNATERNAVIELVDQFIGSHVGEFPA